MGGTPQEGALMSGWTQAGVDASNAKVVAGRPGSKPLRPAPAKAVPDGRRVSNVTLQLGLILNALPSLHVYRVQAALARRNGPGFYG